MTIQTVHMSTRQTLFTLTCLQILMALRSFLYVLLDSFIFLYDAVMNPICIVELQ